MLRVLADNIAGPVCDPNDGSNSLFGIPHWYQYLHHGTKDTFGKCVPSLNDLKEIWLIVLAGIDILLYIAGFVAIGAVLYGGFRYVISQGEPDKTKQARETIINGLVGAVIAIIAASVVTFVARSLT